MIGRSRRMAFATMVWLLRGRFSIAFRTSVSGPKKRNQRKRRRDDDSDVVNISDDDGDDSGKKKKKETKKKGRKRVKKGGDSSCEEDKISGRCRHLLFFAVYFFLSVQFYQIRGV